MSDNNEINKNPEISLALKGMRRMLVAVGLVSIVCLASIVFLIIARIDIAQKMQQIKKQNDELAQRKAALLSSCYEMAAFENRPGDEQNAIKTLDKCMDSFPDDPLLPAYKADVLVHLFTRQRAQITLLDAAIKAADQSLRKSATTEAYESKGIAYCLSAQNPTPSVKESNSKEAIAVFKEELTKFPQRAQTLAYNHFYLDNCSIDIQNSVH